MPDAFDFAREPQVPTEPAARSAPDPTAWMETDAFSFAKGVGGYATEFVGDQARQKKPWGETEKRLSELGVDPEKIKPAYQQEVQARTIAERTEADEGPSPWEQYRRHYMPFGSLVTANRAQAYTSALERYKAGTATDEDLTTIAHQQALGQFDERLAKGSLGLRAIDTLGKVAGMYGENMVAGGLLGKAGLAGPAQTYLGSFGRRMAQTALMPSMYVDQWVNKNIEEGRSASDFRGLPPALALGYANTLVLGRVQNSLGSVAGKAIAGVGESQAVQLGAGFVDEFLPKAYEMGTKYGAIGKILRGEGNEAGKDLALELLTFGAFAGIHKVDGTAKANREAAERGLSVVGEGLKAIDALVKSGMSRDAAADHFRRVNQVFTDGVQAGAETGLPVARQDAVRFFGEILTNPKHPMHEWAKSVAETLPTREEIEAGRPKELAPKVEPTPEPGAEIPHREVPAAETIPPVPETIPPVPETPVPFEHSVEDLRGLAKQLGLSASGGAAAIEARLRKAGAGTILDRIAAEKAPRAPETPPAQPSPEPEIARPGANAEFGNGSDRNRVASEVQKEVDSGDRAVYVDMDVDNMKGLSAHAGDAAAGEHVRAMVRIIGEELARVGRSELFRHAGDPMGDEHSAVVRGADLPAVRQALARAEGRIAAYAREHGFHDIPHAKADRVSRGSGVSAFAEPFVKGRKPAETFAEAESGTETAKARKNQPPAGAETPHPEPAPAPARPAWASSERLRGTVAALDAAEGAERKHVEAALRNAGLLDKKGLVEDPSEDGDRSDREVAEAAARALATVGFREAFKAGAPTGHIEAALRSLGAERVGTAGEPATFDGSVHDGPAGLFTGARVATERPGWVLPDRDGAAVLVKAVVKPLAASEPPAAPGLSKQKQGETDWAHQNRLRREAGATTLADYVKGYGGIDPASLSPRERSVLQENELSALLKDKHGRKGRHAIDTLAEHLVREGYLEPDATGHATDRLVAAVESHRLVAGEEKWAEAEQLRHNQEQWNLEREMEDAQRELERTHGPAASAAARRGADQISAPLREAENAPEAPGHGAGAGEARPGADPGGGPRPARTPAELKEVRKLLAQAQLDEMGREEWADLGAEMQKFYKTEYGLTWKPKKPHRGGSKKVTGDLEALDPEHERVIDESDLSAAEKVGVKAVMAGFSVREAAVVAAGAVKKGGRVPSYETIRKRAVALFGESPVAVVEESARQRALRSKERVRELTNTEEGPDPGVYFHRREPKAPGAETPHPDAPRKEGTAPSDFEVIETQNKLFGTKGYTESVIPGTPADVEAVARTRAATTVTKRVAAGDADINLEEHAHHLVVRLGMPLDAGQLPAGVAEGFRQFWGPQQQPGKRAIVEGFGAWLVARSNRTLDASKMTEAQRLASEYAEGWVKEKGLADAVNKVRDLRAEQAGLTAAERFGLLVSKTGDRSEAVKGTTKERVKEVVDNAIDSQMAKKVDDLYAMATIERADAARRKAQGLAPAAPGTLPSEVYRAARYRASAESAEMAASGVHYYDKDGKQVRIGKSYAKIAEDHKLSAEEVANGGALDQFARAREAVYLADQGRPNRSPEQVELARKAMEEFQSNPERFKQLEAAANDVTKLFNDSFLAMEKMGYFPEGTLDKFKDRNPYYTPNTRLLDPDQVRNLRTGDTGGKGSKGSPGFTKARSASGEEMIGLADAVADRIDYTAYVVTRQMKDKAFFEFFNRDGLGDDVHFQPVALREDVQQMLAQIRDSGKLSRDQMTEVVQSIIERPEAFVQGTWDADSRRLSYVFMVDGKPVRALVNNRPLHDVLVGTQGEGETTMKVAAALSAVSRPIAQLQRLGFTALSPLYHLHNLMPWRDAATYLGRTTSEKGFIADVKDVYKWYASSLAYYAQKLIGRDPSNVYFRLYDQMVQRNMDANAQLGTGSAKIVTGGWRGLYQRVTDLMGFGEKALHVAEMKNVWDKAGYTEERIRAELAADPTGASPIPFALQVAAYNAAAQVTHNYLTMGYQVRELNKGWPFLGVHIASAYKDIVTMRERPKVALRGLSVLFAAKLLQWALYKDDEEYKQLSVHRRDGFIFKTPVGWIGMPGPRGIQTPLLAVMDETLRAASGSNPQFHSLVGRTIHQVGLHGGPAGLATGLELLANRTQGGFPIVPKWDADLPASEKLTKYQLPYAAAQMTGGIVPAEQVAKGGYDPLKGLLLPPQHETVTRLRELVEELKGEQLSAKRAGARFKDQNRYDRLAHAEAEVRNLSAKLAKMQDATAEDRAAVNRRQVAIAKRALGE